MNHNSLSVIPCLLLAALSLRCSSDPSTSPIPERAGTGGKGTTTGGDGGSIGTGLTGAGSGGAAAGALSAGGTSSSGGDSNLGGSSGSSGSTPNGGSSGGGLGAAGATSAGSGGAPGTAGAATSANCPAGALLCDDFESYTSNAAPSGKWKVTNVGMPTTVVDGVHAFSGSKAAHFHGVADNNRQYTFMTAQQAPTFPVLSNKVFVRFMLYIGRWPSATATHTRLAWLGTAQALSTPQRGFDGGGYVLCNYNGVAIERLASGYFRNTSANMREDSRVGKWSCFEMEIDNTGGPPTGGVGGALPHIFEDDKEYTLALAGDHSVPYNAIKFEALQFSLWSPQTDTVTADYWIDDVAMSTQRISCPSKESGP